MASFFLTIILFTAQALSTLIPVPTTATSTSIVPSTTVNSFCPGSIITPAPLTFPFASTDTSDPDTPFCCVASLKAPAPPLTKWLYNHTGTAIPSIVIRPTTCVQPIPLSATDYAARATAAAIAHVIGLPRQGSGIQAVMQLAENRAERPDSEPVKAPAAMTGAAVRLGNPKLVAGVSIAATLGSVVMSTPFVLAFVLMWFTTIVGA